VGEEYKDTVASLRQIYA